MGRRNSADLNMGVLACYRNGCTNIMCDRYSHEHGYICYDCFAVLACNFFNMRYWRKDAASLVIGTLAQSYKRELDAARGAFLLEGPCKGFAAHAANPSGHISKLDLETAFRSAIVFFLWQSRQSNQRLSMSFVPPSLKGILWSTSNMEQGFTFV